MTPVWCIAHPGGEPTYRDTEQAAEQAAAELVRSGRAKVATFYRLMIHDDGGSK